MRKKFSWSLYLFMIALAFGVGLTTTLVASHVFARSGTQETSFEAPADGPARPAPRTVEC